MDRVAFEDLPALEKYDPANIREYMQYMQFTQHHLQDRRLREHIAESDASIKAQNKIFDRLNAKREGRTITPERENEELRNSPAQGLSRASTLAVDSELDSSVLTPNSTGREKALCELNDGDLGEGVVYIPEKIANSVVHEVIEHLEDVREVSTETRQPKPHDLKSCDNKANSQVDKGIQVEIVGLVSQQDHQELRKHTDFLQEELSKFETYSGNLQLLHNEMTINHSRLQKDHERLQQDLTMAAFDLNLQRKETASLKKEIRVVNRANRQLQKDALEFRKIGFEAEQEKDRLRKEMTQRESEWRKEKEGILAKMGKSKMGDNPKERHWKKKFVKFLLA